MRAGGRAFIQQTLNTLHIKHGWGRRMAKHAKEDFCKAGKGVEPDHCGCIEYPVDELQKLRKFLEPQSVYFNGHPKDDADVIALRGALENVLANAVVESALAVIKSAVREGGWFMLVLEDHQTPNDSEEFKDALSCCKRLAAYLSIKEYDVARMSDMAAGQHTEIARGLGIGRVKCVELGDQTEGVIQYRVVLFGQVQSAYQLFVLFGLGN
jgi:hypothetical protein